MLKKFAIISDNEEELIKAIEEHNKNDNKLWKLPNLVAPISAILLALICHLAFSENRFSLINYFNLIINGSLPLIAINQISSTGVHIFRYDKSQEERFGKDTFMLRTKLFWFSIAILIISVILFAFQVITNPFESWILLIALLSISILLIKFSSYVSRRVYLLQECFIESTYADQILEETNSIHGTGWENNG